MHFAAVAFVLLCVMQISVAFIHSSIKYQRRALLRMTPEQEQAMNYIKQKQAQDPNYDPTNDPQYQQMMMQLIPEEIRDVSSGIERLKVAFKDATEGNLLT